MKHLILSRILLTLTLLFSVMSVASASDRFYLDPINIEAGDIKTLRFNLENEQVYYGFQVDIDFPDGIQVETDSNGKVECSLSHRFDSSYSLLSNSLSDGSVRFGAFSSNHTAISGSDGVVLLIKVKASDNFEGGTLYIKNAYFVGEKDKDVELDNSNVSIGNKYNNMCYIPDFSISVGESKTIQLELDNETPFCAFQTDLILPQGILFTDCSITSRCKDHVVSLKNDNNERIRIVCMSMSSAQFEGNSGGVLDIQLTATADAAEIGTIQVNSNIFTTSEAREYLLPKLTTQVTVIHDESLLGDINNDKEVNVTDIVALYSYILGNTNGVDKGKVDLNNDGEVNVTDIVSLYSIILTLN